jgi:hypothetical protein
LPSQIQNFTAQFFGTVVKTEVDGQVEWSLPCGLDVGLENNPRGEDEGLACYFLRLFSEGIIGATGPQGETGSAGTNGHNAYTVTTAGFVQPTLGAPNITVTTAFNPAILSGLYVFIATSGWYLVTQADVTGTLFLTLAKPVSGASGTIVAGKLVVPAGFPGISVVGPQGPQGPKGDTGSPGTSFTAVNGMYFAAVGTNYNLQIAYNPVTFINSAPQVLLSAKGNYLVTVVAGIIGIGAVTLADIASLKLRNTSNASDVDGSEHKISNMVVDENKQIVINVLVTTDGANQTIALEGKATTADIFAIVALRTTITYVRVS